MSAAECRAYDAAVRARPWLQGPGARVTYRWGFRGTALGPLPPEGHDAMRLARRCQALAADDAPRTLKPAAKRVLRAVAARAERYAQGTRPVVEDDPYAKLDEAAPTPSSPRSSTNTAAGRPACSSSTRRAWSPTTCAA
jgi:hypothetical protein